MRRRLLVLGDQAASSLSNIVVVILVAREGSAALVGFFALGMIAFQLVVGAIRSVVGEPLLSLHAHEPAYVRGGLESELLGTTLLLGVVCAVLLWPLAVVVGGPTGSALVALAWVLPLVVVQDTWRYVFVIDRPAAALAIDLVWLGAILLAIPLLPADASVGTYVIAWGLTGGLGALLGTALGGWPRMVRPWKWLVDHRAMSGRYLADFAVARGAGHAVQVALPVMSGAAALGAVRAALVFYGFLNVAHSGLYLALVPEGARRRDQPRRVRRMFVRASVLTATLSLAWMIVGVVLPASAGRWLFSDTWSEAVDLLVPLGVAVTIGGILSGAVLGLRAVGDARLTLRARRYSTPFQLICPLVGARLGDAVGFAIGFGIGMSITAVIWWVLFARATSGASLALPLGAADDFGDIVAGQEPVGAAGFGAARHSAVTEGVG